MKEILTLLGEKLKGQLVNARQLFGKKVLLVLIWIQGILYYSNSETLRAIPDLPLLFTIVTVAGILAHGIADAGSHGMTSFQNKRK